MKVEQGDSGQYHGLLDQETVLNKLYDRSSIYETEKGKINRDRNLQTSYFVQKISYLCAGGLLNTG